MSVFTEVSNFNFITIKIFSLSQNGVFFLHPPCFSLLGYLLPIIKVINNRNRERLQIEWFHNFGTTFDKIKILRPKLKQGRYSEVWTFYFILFLERNLPFSFLHAWAKSKIFITWMIGSNTIGNSRGTFNSKKTP